MKQILLLCTLFLLNLKAMASLQQSFNKDVSSIKSLAGCYKVTFQNAETFSLSKDYVYRDRFKTGGLEWIFIDSENEDDNKKQISLQHLLIVPGGHIIKHWRQEWNYQGIFLFEFLPPFSFAGKQLSENDVQGEWTQKVYQVDDSPRYECSAPWIHTRVKNYWECEADAPLPRREFTVRNDYNILRRTNRHEIIEGGHLHHEDNVKILKNSQGEMIPLVMEKGLNHYKRVDNKECQVAVDWWNKHQDFWKDTRAVWNDIYEKNHNGTLNFKEKVDGATLWEKLFELDQKFTQGQDYNGAMVRSSVQKTIENFLF